jgi:predicted lipid-binding transport protein (Tim44 family)
MEPSRSGSPRRRSEARPSAWSTVLRLLGGALFGLLLGLFCSFGLAEGDETKLVIFTASSVALCALLAWRYGKTLWDYVSQGTIWWP